MDTTGRLRRVMKVAIAVAFASTLVIGTGCAITNYSIITDNDQVSNGQGSGIVRTDGKAHVRDIQVAVTWSDGTDALFSMVDQKSNGDRTLTTYNNFSTGDDPPFHDDVYCNPDWQGCAIYTAPDPEVGDYDRWDGTYNPSCDGARSFSKALSTSRYYGECGRARMPLSDRLVLLNSGRPGAVRGREALLYGVDRGRIRVHLDNNAGVVRPIPFSGNAEVALFVGGGRQMTIDATNPLLSNVGHRVADFLEAYGTNHTTITVTYNGIAMSFEAGGELFRPERLRAVMERRF